MNNPAYGTALLRITLGVIFIAHSLYLKVFVFTIAGTVGFFESLGLPGFLAYVTLFVEGIGGILLIVGFQSRWVGLALVPIALGATWAHSGAGWIFSNAGGGWEYPLFLAITSGVIAIQGSGALSIDEKISAA